MPSHPALLTPPARLPKVKFLTERQLATLVKVTPETLRAWRRRGEMPPIAVGPEVDEFIATVKGRGPNPVCYRCSDIFCLVIWQFWSRRATQGSTCERIQSRE